MTPTLPGWAIWHMPWTDKNDSTDRTAYFHVGNRLITLALHSPATVSNADGSGVAFRKRDPQNSARCSSARSRCTDGWLRNGQHRNGRIFLIELCIRQHAVGGPQIYTQYMCHFLISSLC